MQAPDESRNVAYQGIAAKEQKDNCARRFQEINILDLLGDDDVAIAQPEPAEHPLVQAQIIEEEAPIQQAENPVKEAKAKANHGNQDSEDDGDIGENIDCDEYEDLEVSGAYLPFVAQIHQDGVRNRKMIDVNANFDGRKPNIWFIEEKLKELADLMQAHEVLKTQLQERPLRPTEDKQTNTDIKEEIKEAKYVNQHSLKRNQSPSFSNKAKSFKNDLARVMNN